MRTSLFYISVLLLGICFGCKEDSNQKTNLTKEVTFTKEGTLTILDATTTKEKTSFDIEIADDEYQTQTGLMYRKSMEENQGMLFIFEKEQPRSFYMKNTLFALDIIYINAEKKIVSIQKNAQPLDPTSLPSRAPTKYVLEINGGLSDRLGIAKGDSFEFVRN